MIGEDIVANAPCSKQAHTKLHLQIDPLPAGDEIGVKLNGKEVRPGKRVEPPTTQPGNVRASQAASCLEFEV